MSGCIRAVAIGLRNSKNKCWPHRGRFFLSHTALAPGDVERDDLRQMIPGWAPIVRQPLPFRALVIATDSDPYCAVDRARGMATDWSAGFVDAVTAGIGGAGGHLNGESGLGDWPEGRAMLNEISKEH
jgi:predicted alpha/beta hydrolase family esterase